MAKNKVLTDSLALTGVKLFTMGAGILSTIILSRTLPLTGYGTYSTGSLIINTAALLSVFGLTDAVNYYYNGRRAEDREAYINTLFALFLVCGGTAALVILCCQGLITRYFHNPALGAIYLYIAFRPLLQNCASGLQNLQVSIGKAKLAAVRNAVISSAKLGAVLLASFYTRSVTTVFICMLTVEALSVFFYDKTLRDSGVHIHPFRADRTKLREILAFCVPMGVCIQASSLSRDMDKFVIGFFENTDNLAIYANCAAKLPLDLVSGPLLTLLIPLLTRCIRNGSYAAGARLFRCYLKIGYIFTCSFGIGCILVRSQAVQFLYGPKYMAGVPVFTIYIVVDMLNFISCSLVLSAKGRTKELMKISCCALPVNLAANLLLYRTMGFIGPAAATVLVTFGINLILLTKSAGILGESVFSLFDRKHLLRYGCEAAALSAPLLFFREYLESAGVHYFVILALVGGLFVGGMLLLNRSEIRQCFALLGGISRKEAG